MDVDLTAAAKELGLPDVPPITYRPGLGTGGMDTVKRQIVLDPALLDGRSYTSRRIAADIAPLLPLDAPAILTHTDLLRFILGHELGHLKQADETGGPYTFWREYQASMPLVPTPTEYRANRYEHEADLIGAHLMDLITIKP